MSNAGIQYRTELLHHLGDAYGGDRDFYKVLGYERRLTAEDYRAKFERQDIARRIIELPAEETWKTPPKIESTNMMKNALDDIVKDLNLWHYCKRADVVSGIGEYGVLFLGFSDNLPFSEPVNEPDGLEYLTPFAQDQVHDWILGKEAGLEPTDEMYNKPVIYQIDFSDVDADQDESDIREVHHSRLIHIAEGLVDSDLKGTPRLRPVYNRLIDLEKVVGASAEMFWAGADRKFHFNIDSDNVRDIPDDQLDQMDEEVQKLVHDMQHYIKTFNTEVDVFDGDEPDPSGIKDVILSIIAASTGIPKRILEGSERGELASTQDRANWYGKIESRQNNFAAPMIVRPLIDRLQEFNLIPGSDYEVVWESLFELTELELTEAMQRRGAALQSAAPNADTDLLFESHDQILKFLVYGEVPDEISSEIEALNEDDEQVQKQWEITVDDIRP